jgi:hypothetical protein
LTVAPADITTAVALTVTAPDGTETTVTMVGGDLVEIPDTSPTEYSQVWTADTPVVYDAAGKWLLHYAVTGTGEGAEDLPVYVVSSPVAGGPTWTPGRSRVAAYVAHRTLEYSLETTGDGEDAWAQTFTSTTRPSGVQVDRLIADGVDWVSSRVYPLNTRSEGMAAWVAAYWAAIAVERQFPDNPTEALQRANDMERQLNSMLTGLIESNQTANDLDSGATDYGIDIAVWAFPPADCRWDSANYW